MSVATFARHHKNTVQNRFYLLFIIPYWILSILYGTTDKNTQVFLQIQQWDLKSIFPPFIPQTTDIPQSYFVEKHKIYEVIPLETKNFILDELTLRKFFMVYPQVINFDTYEKVINHSSTLSTTYAHLKNMYVDSSMVLSDGKYRYKLENIYAFNNTYWNRTGYLVGFFDHVIAVGDIHSNEYGHFILDSLCPLMCIPRDIWKKSKILIQHRKKYIKDMLHCLGFQDHQMILIVNNQFIFGKNVYTTMYPASYMRHKGTAVANLSKIFRESLKLDEIKQYRYALTYRDKRRYRYVSNMKEIYRYAKKSRPTYKWELIDEMIPDFYSAVKTYAEMKFLFTISSSGLSHLLFMKPKTVVVVAQGDFNDFNFMSFALVGRILYFVFTNNFTHYQKSIHLNMSHVTRAMDIGFYALDYGTFPPNSTQYHYLK